MIDERGNAIVMNVCIGPRCVCRLYVTISAGRAVAVVALAKHSFRFLFV